MPTLSLSHYASLTHPLTDAERADVARLLTASGDVLTEETPKHPRPPTLLTGKPATAARFA